MNIARLTHRATYTPSAGWIRKWQKEPGNQDYAVRAAIQTARKLQESVVLVPGNSYGNRVYHITKQTDDIRKYVPDIGDCKISVLVIRKTGEIFTAEAGK